MEDMLCPQQNKVADMKWGAEREGSPLYLLEDTLGMVWLMEDSLQVVLGRVGTQYWHQFELGCMAYLVLLA